MSGILQKPILDSSIPAGWVVSSIGEFVREFTGGCSTTKDDYLDSGVLVLNKGNIKTNGYVTFDGEPKFVSEAYASTHQHRLLQTSDLIVTLRDLSQKADFLGLIGVYKETESALLTQGAYRIRLFDGIIPNYLVYFSNCPTYRKVAKKSKHGSTQVHLRNSDFLGFQIPIPPLNEQRRIVERIEELFSDLDAGIAALKRAKTNLKRYRAAVLKAAVEGKLTEEWRAKHPHAEPASKLLARILTERRQKWESDQLAKFSDAGKEPPNGWKEKYTEPTPPDTADLPLVPDSWVWASLEAIADVIGGITKDQKKANRPGMRDVPYLRVANVQRGFLDLSEIKSISASEDDIAELRLKRADILFTEGGDRDKLGRGWIWSDELNECIHQNHIFRGRLLSADKQARFVSHHANTFGKEWFINAGKQTTNLASINLGILRRFPVPIPPASEQAAIIGMVDEKLSQIDAAENAIEHGLLRAARLRQSILKQAFEGKLVPQDPNDEPASVMLDKLHGGQTEEAPKKQRRTRQSPNV